MITVPLTRERRTVYWTVAAYDAHGQSLYRTTGLQSAAPTRYWHKFWASRRETARTEITEHTLVVANTPIGFQDLPGEGEPTLPPDLPAGAHEVKRFFKFTSALEDGSLTGYGPAVLRTGDDVRRFYDWTVATQGHPHAVHVDVSTLRILDCTLTHYTREIRLDDLLKDEPRQPHSNEPGPDRIPSFPVGRARQRPADGLTNPTRERGVHAALRAHSLISRTGPAQSGPGAHPVR